MTSSLYFVWRVRTGNAAASSLKVSISAWVELLHRGRQEGQLAFMVAVRGVPAASHYPISPSKLSSKTNNGGDDLPPSPSRSALSYSWTCLRTGRDLSGVVTAHRESVENNATVNDWQPEPRPRVISHMSTADQVDWMFLSLSMRAWERVCPGVPESTSFLLYLKI